MGLADVDLDLKDREQVPIRAEYNSNTFSRYTLNGSPLTNLTLASDLGVPYELQPRST